MKKQGIELTDVSAPLAGVVSFHIDSYSAKGLTEDDISASLFEQSTMKQDAAMQGTKGQNNYVNAGDVVYRIVPSEEWKVIFPLGDKETRENTKSLRVNFIGSNISMSGDYHEISDKDESSKKRYGVLTFQRYMDSISRRPLCFFPHCGGKQGRSQGDKKVRLRRKNSTRFHSSI